MERRYKSKYTDEQKIAYYTRRMDVYGRLNQLATAIEDQDLMDYTCYEWEKAENRLYHLKNKPKQDWSSDLKKDLERLRAIVQKKKNPA